VIDPLTRFFWQPRIAPFYQVAFSVLAGVLTACAANKANPLYSNLPAPAPLGSVRQMAYTRIPFPNGNWVELAQREVDGRRFSGAESSERKAYVASVVMWARGFEHWVVDGTKDQLPPFST
jgi:hypothetical protein